MLLYANLDLGDGVIRPIAITSSMQNDESKLYFSQVEMLGDVYILKAMAQQNMRCKVTTCNGKPIVIHESGGEDFTAVYDLFAKVLENTFPDAQYEEIANKVNSQLGGGFTGEDIKRFKEGCLALKKYRDNPPSFRINIDLTFIVDLDVKDVINKINDNITGLSFVSSGINKTLFMDKPSSKVFIKIPMYPAIIEDNYSLPSRGEIMPEYEDVLFYTPDYKEKALVFDIPLIEGSVENNKKGIYDNEREYYNALKELIDYGISQKYPDNTLEECIEKCIYDTDVYNYILDLIIRAAYFNWDHVGLLPEHDDEEDDDDDITSEKSTEDSGGGGMFYSKKQSNGTFGFTGGLTKIKGYVDAEVSRNIYAPIDILLRMLRWGNRKPRAIVLENGFTELDLNSFSILTPQEGIDDGVVKIENGVEFHLAAVVEASGDFKDLTYLRNQGVNFTGMNVPVGAMCIRHFSIDDGKRTLYQRVYMSLADIAELLEERPNAINGIKKDSNGNFSVSFVTSLEEQEALATNLLQSLAVINTSATKEDYLFVSNRVINHALTLNAKTTNLGYLGLMRKYFYSAETNMELGRLNYISKAEFISKASEHRDANGVVQANIASELFPSMLKAINEGIAIQIDNGEVSLEEMLNIYALAYLKDPITLDLDDVQSSPIKTATENKLERLMIKGKSEEGDMVMGLKESLGNLIYMNVPADAVLTPVKVKQVQAGQDSNGKKVYTQTGMEQVVAFYTTIKTDTGTKYLFTTIDEERGTKAFDSSNGLVAQQIPKALTLGSMVTILFNDFGRILMGKENDTKIRFANEKAMVTIINAMNKAKIDV